MHNVVPITKSLFDSTRLASSARQSLVAMWSHYRAWQMRRASVHILRALDDRLLQDIGLERGDIEKAASGRQRAAC